MDHLHVRGVHGRVSPRFAFGILGERVDRFGNSRRSQRKLMKLTGLLEGDLRLARGLDVPLQRRLSFIQACVGLRRADLKSSFVLALSVSSGLGARRVVVPSVVMRVPMRGTVGRKLTKVRKRGQLAVSMVSRNGKIQVVVMSGNEKCLPRVVSPSEKANANLGILCRAVRLLGRGGGKRGVYFRVGGLTSKRRAKAYISMCVPCGCSCSL